MIFKKLLSHNLISVLLLGTFGIWGCTNTQPPKDMLAKTADYYEKEVDNQIRTISTIIEPVLMVILGVVAFIIVAAVLLPIYGLAGQKLGGISP